MTSLPRIGILSLHIFLPVSPSPVAYIKPDRSILRARDHRKIEPRLTLYSVYRRLSPCYSEIEGLGRRHCCDVPNLVKLCS